MSLISPARVGHCVLPPTSDVDGGLRMSLKADGVQLFVLTTATRGCEGAGTGPGTEAAIMAGAEVFATGRLHFTWRGWGAVGLLTVGLRDRSGTGVVSASGSYRARVDRHDGLEPLSAAPGPGEPMPASVALVDTAGRIRAVRREVWPPYAADRVRDVLQALDRAGGDPEQELHRLRMLSGAASPNAQAGADAASPAITWSTVAR